MEIKNTCEIMEDGKNIIMNNIGKIPIEEFSNHQMKKWIAIDELIFYDIISNQILDISVVVDRIEIGLKDSIGVSLK